MFTRARSRTSKEGYSPQYKTTCMATTSSLQHKGTTKFKYNGSVTCTHNMHSKQCTLLSFDFHKSTAESFIKYHQTGLCIATKIIIYTFTCMLRPSNRLLTFHVMSITHRFNQLIIGHLSTPSQSITGTCATGHSLWYPPLKRKFVQVKLMIAFKSGNVAFTICTMAWNTMP